MRLAYKLQGFANSMGMHAQKLKWVFLSFPLAVRKSWSNNTGSKRVFSED